MLLNILQRKHRTVPKMRNDPAPAVDSMEVKKLPKNHCVSFENQHKGANKVICEKKNRNTSITKQNKTKQVFHRGLCTRPADLVSFLCHAWTV